MAQVQRDRVLVSVHADSQEYERVGDAVRAPVKFSVPCRRLRGLSRRPIVLFFGRCEIPPVRD